MSYGPTAALAEEPAAHTEAGVATAVAVNVAAVVGAHEFAEDDRSTRDASDLAKGFEIPVVHVNADDVRACLAVAKLALRLPRALPQGLRHRPGRLLPLGSQ
jgi:hypothetical protein